MKAAYFDCFAGISGDMILGALVDAGLDVEQLKMDLGKLPLAGYALAAEKTVKCGVAGTKVYVRCQEEHEHRHLYQIQEIIAASGLPEPVKIKSIAVFARLAEAEAKVHRSSVERVHFHEVGAVDAIVDIVGAVSGLWRLGIERVHASPLNTGRGVTKSAHGIIPIPAPATLELLKDIPIYASDVARELVTPTGAALVSTLAESFGPLPPMRVSGIGYGAGDWELPMPNMLRITVGELLEASNQAPGFDDVRFGGSGAVRFEPALMMEANIDDMNPEYYDHLLQRLFQAGAMDAFVQNIHMKKNRPAQLLSVMINPNQVELFYRLIFTETSTIGLRVYPVTKYMLPYERVGLDTEWGEVRVKVARLGEVVTNISPEYEDCRKVAEVQGIPLKDVYERVRQLARQALR